MPASHQEESKSESKSMTMPASHQEKQTDPVSLVTRLRLAAYRRGLCDHGVDVDEGKYESYKAELCAKAAENKSKGGKGGKGVGAQKEKKEKKDKKDKQEKSPAPLPFDGVKNEDNCEAVRLNSGLYTQCALKKKADQRWCLACGKQAAKNSSGKPDNGAMEDRLAVGPMEYVDPKGRKVVAYCAVLKKLKVSQAEMVAYCESANLPPIMAVHLQEAEAEKEKEKEEGSKKKAKKAKKVKEEVEVKEEVKEEVEVKEKEKKGRPKKAKKEPTVTSNSTEDLFASLVSQQQQQQQEAKVDEKKVDDKKKRGGGAKKEAPAPAPVPVAAAASTMAPVKRERTPVLEDEVDNTIVASSSKAGNPVPVSVSVTDSELAEEQEEQEQDEDEEEEDHVEPVKVGRKNYLRSMKSGVMYDAKTQEPVGIWNPTTKKIDELPAEEGDDEDEE